MIQSLTGGRPFPAGPTIHSASNSHSSSAFSSPALSYTSSTSLSTSSSFASDVDELTDGGEDGDDSSEVEQEEEGRWRGGRTRPAVSSVQRTLSTTTHPFLLRTSSQHNLRPTHVRPSTSVVSLLHPLSTHPTRLQVAVYLAAHRQAGALTVV